MDGWSWRGSRQPDAPCMYSLLTRVRDPGMEAGQAIGLLATGYDAGILCMLLLPVALPSVSDSHRNLDDSHTTNLKGHRAVSDFPHQRATGGHRARSPVVGVMSIYMWKLRFRYYDFRGWCYRQIT